MMAPENACIEPKPTHIQRPHFVCHLNIVLARMEQKEWIIGAEIGWVLPHIPHDEGVQSNMFSPVCITEAHGAASHWVCRYLPLLWYA